MFFINFKSTSFTGGLIQWIRDKAVIVYFLNLFPKMNAGT